MSNNFDQFRALQVSNKQSVDQVAVKFITNGLPSLEIYDESKKRYVSAAVVYDNDEFQDAAYVYVKEEGELNVGSSIRIPTGEHLMIVDKEFIAKNVKFYKYLAFVTNVQIDAENWGFFKSENMTSTSVSLKKNILFMSTQKPILVAKNGILNIDDIIIVNERPWRVIEQNSSSNIYVSYYILQATTAPKDSTEIDDIEVAVDPSIINVNAFQSVTLATQDAYFIPSVNLQFKLSQNSVQFIVPVEASEFTVKIKSNLGVETKKYKVVL